MCLLHQFHSFTFNVATLVVRIVQVSVYEMFRRYVSSSSAIAAECMHAGSYGEGTIAAGCIHVGSYGEGSRG